MGREIDVSALGGEDSKVNVAANRPIRPSLSPTPQFDHFWNIKVQRHKSTVRYVVNPPPNCFGVFPTAQVDKSIKQILSYWK
jgi:hypothetical protein